MKYQFLATHQQEYPIKTMCRVLEVAMSGYSAWLRRLSAQPPQPGEHGGGGVYRAHLSVQPPGVWQSTHSHGSCASKD